MSFRRDKSTAIAWQSWLDAHREELIACGAPDFLYADEMRWHRFVEHDYDHETGWSPQLLTLADAEKFKLFLDRLYPERLR